MCSSNVKVVGNDREGRDDLVEKGLASRPAPAGSDLYSDAELGDCDGGDGWFVVVSDERVEIEDVTLGVDQDVRVEQQRSQNRSSVTRKPRSSATSRAHSRSTR